MKHAPKGRLQISKSNGITQYYYIPQNESKKKIYIRKSDIAKAQKIAQRDYEQQFLHMAQREKKRMSLVIKNIYNEELQNLHMKLKVERRNLINPIVLSDEEYVGQWLKVSYEGKEFSDNESLIITERGERVRSKSEKIIADKLYSMGIPYRYEYPLHLNGYGVVYPDFTILDIKTRTEKYIEHFGMMDDPVYSRGMVNKIEEYQKNGIYLGKQLFATFEYSKKSLNVFTLEMMLKEML